MCAQTEEPSARAAPSFLATQRRALRFRRSLPGLMSNEVHRVGNNLNQAVAQLNATGLTPVWLKDVAVKTEERVN